MTPTISTTVPTISTTVCSKHFKKQHSRAFTYPSFNLRRVKLFSSYLASLKRWTVVVSASIWVLFLLPPREADNGDVVQKTSIPVLMLLKMWTRIQPPEQVLPLLVVEMDF
ncbi:uncharacterized protein LOC108211099 isoform X1 [Daucus carota subsp. sativus]|uniref:uncharacterized protein LOC108211099 isoform X1 n=1 Tax=Daucus carota subsp. sativus TaxID=79200 RepID=UPI0030837A58